MRAYRDPALDVEKQNEQINDLIEMGIDVLIINPVDYSKVNDSLKKAKEKGIKIIVIDAQLDDDTIADTTVLSNNYDAGVQCAKDMMRNLSSAKIVLLKHSAALSSVDRINGFLDTIKDNANYTVVASEECLWYPPAKITTSDIVITSQWHKTYHLVTLKLPLGKIDD